MPLPGYEFLYIYEEKEGGKEMKRVVPVGQVAPSSSSSSPVVENVAVVPDDWPPPVKKQSSAKKMDETVVKKNHVGGVLSTTTTTTTTATTTTTTTATTTTASKEECDEKNLMCVEISTKDGEVDATSSTTTPTATTTAADAVDATLTATAAASAATATVDETNAVLPSSSSKLSSKKIKVDPSLATSPRSTTSAAAITTPPPTTTTPMMTRSRSNPSSSTNKTIATPNSSSSSTSNNAKKATSNNKTKAKEKEDAYQPKKYQMCWYKLRDGIAKVSLPLGFHAKLDTTARGRHVRFCLLFVLHSVNYCFSTPLFLCRRHRHRHRRRRRRRRLCFGCTHTHTHIHSPMDLYFVVVFHSIRYTYLSLHNPSILRVYPSSIVTNVLHQWAKGSKLGDMIIPSPIKQAISGIGGVYEYTLLEQPAITVAQYRTLADEYRKRQLGNEYDTDQSDEVCDELARKFWRRLGPTMEPPVYGADMEGTLFNKDSYACGWNVNKLESCLCLLRADVKDGDGSCGSSGGGDDDEFHPTRRDQRLPLFWNVGQCLRGAYRGYEPTLH